MGKSPLMILACALATGLTITASAQDKAATEVTTAHAHALMAQHAATLTMADAHLHHVINCLVGSKGAGFDAAAGTPCKGQGNGAIPDSASDQALRAKLETALTEARAGLESSTLASAQQAAAKVAAALQSTPAQKASGGYSW